MKIFQEADLKPRSQSSLRSHNRLSQTAGFSVRLCARSLWIVPIVCFGLTGLTLAKAEAASTGFFMPAQKSLTALSLADEQTFSSQKHDLREYLLEKLWRSQTSDSQSSLVEPISPTGISDAPSVGWLVAMLAIPLAGGGLIYIQRQLLSAAKRGLCKSSKRPSDGE